MAHYIQYNEIEIRVFVAHSSLANSYFPNRLQGVVIDCCTSGENWKQVIRFFIEYGTVARLGERTEHCMPALWATQATKTIFHCTLAVAF